MKHSLLPLAGLAAFLTLSACMEDMPRPERPGPPDRPMCTREYAPVCAAKGWKRKTFSNACMAQTKGYSVISEQACGKN